MAPDYAALRPLLRIQPSPVVELNRAVAVAMCEGPEQGLCLIDDLLAREQLSHYHLAHSARADLCRRLGRIPEAVLRMRRRSPWRGSNRSAVFSRGGSRN
jgi:predicted RNA polymerase sigma factor